MLFQLFHALDSSRQRQLRATAAALCTLVLCAGCGLPEAALSSFAKPQASNTVSDEFPTIDGLGSPGDKEFTTGDDYPRWTGGGDEFGTTFANTSPFSPLWLIPEHEPGILDSSYRSGTHAEILTGDEVRFLGPVNNYHSFIVNIDASLNYYDSTTYEYEGSINAEHCSSTNNLRNTYCADPFSNSILVISTIARSIEGRIPFDTHLSDIQLINSSTESDLLKVRDENANTMLLGVDNHKTIQFKNYLDIDAYCGITNQDQVLLCSEPEGHGFQLSTFHLFSNTWGCSMHAKGRVLTAAYGWIVATDDKLEYYNTECELIEQAPVDNRMFLNAYPWHTPLLYSKSSPHPKREIDLMLQQPMELYNTYQNVVRVKQANNDDDFSIEYGTASITLSPHERIVSMDLPAELVLTAAEHELTIIDTQTGELVFNAPHQSNYFVTIRDGWFASHAPDGNGQMVTVFVPTDLSKYNIM